MRVILIRVFKVQHTIRVVTSDERPVSVSFIPCDGTRSESVMRVIFTWNKSSAGYNHMDAHFIMKAVGSENLADFMN